ncbi:FAD-dependent oxidoreductase [Candidatus Acidianus copahuensis]|uniref:FAD-dependent oxidoreductase n=1 Tax=Candidatus Acidianus copahuensis TaxID=1160895 RepID=A0A031LPT2_9CREN|nr:FAD-binding oxidoreductase [Candidatus Acidianus copahuensis]EZQ04808.1 FAD-dependent oxidoreductase [Candidatus Acidianus copahuensis]
MKVAIIGAGILGSSLFYMLKEAGHDTIVIDPRVRRIFPSLIHSLLLKGKDVELARTSLDFYRKVRIPMKEFPSITLGKVSEDLISLWSSEGVEIKEQFIDWINASGLVAIGGDRLVYIKRLIDSVPIIREKASIYSSNGKAYVKVNGKSIDADIVILSAGPWNNLLFKVNTKSYYCWASLVTTEERRLDSIFIYDYELNYYSRPFLGIGTNTAIVGDGEAIESPPCKKIKVNSEEVLSKARKRLKGLFNIYTNGEFCEGTPDMRPAYGKLLDNLYYVGGLDGYGAEVGPGMAKLLLDFIFHGHETKEYRLERFKGIIDFKLGKEPHEI